MKTKISDPTKEEMISFLSSLYGNEEEFEFDAEVAIYGFAQLYHGGQSSNLYSVLSTSEFSPGPMWRISNDEVAYMMYQDLRNEFGGS